jgi:hypothetical protein
MGPLFSDAPYGTGGVPAGTSHIQMKRELLLRVVQSVASLVTTYGSPTAVVAKPSAKNGAVALTRLLPTKLIGSNACTVKQPDITATKNARNAKVLSIRMPAG